jgi:hypothetical protein
MMEMFSMPLKSLSRGAPTSEDTFNRAQSKQIVLRPQICIMSASSDDGCRTNEGTGRLMSEVANKAEV